MQCFALPETLHDLRVTVYVKSLANVTADDQALLKTGITNMVRCAFRENADYDVKKTWPYARFSFRHWRQKFTTNTLADSLVFSLPDIISELSILRLKTLTVELLND
jgi:hypothetical protein